MLEKMYYRFKKIMPEYNFKHDCSIHDKIYFLTILYAKILYNIFIMLSHGDRAISNFFPNFDCKVHLWTRNTKHFFQFTEKVIF